jgi:membrane protein implicated in regulation of membrane protease activity
VTTPNLARRVLGLAAAVAAGIGLWRFTSGDWQSGIVVTLAVSGIAAWLIWESRRARGGRRY